MNWLTRLFTPKRKFTETIPQAHTPEDPIMDQLTLVQKFTTKDEPKLADFPKIEYRAYWEIILGELDDGAVAAEIRIYGYDGVGFIRGHRITGPSCEIIKPHVNAWILDQMAQLKR